jgi:dipeptidyl aminopeptidase/acylaminoacyl peptidase
MITRVVATLAAFALWSFGSAWGDGRAPTVADLARIVKVGDLHFSPDGKTLAYVETRANVDSDEYESEIELIAVSGADARPLTRRHHARSPQWSPSGDHLGFLAPDADKITQLYVMPMAGGDALQLTKGKDGVHQFAWSPDGASIAFAMADPKPELKGEERFRTAFKVGNDDITTQEAPRPVHLWLVAAEGGEPKRLTSGTWSLPSSLPPGPPSSPIAWSRDAKSIVFVRQETPSTGESSGAVRRSPPLDRRDRDDHSELFANMARGDGSTSQCLGLCRLNLTDTCGRPSDRSRLTAPAGRLVGCEENVCESIAR